MKLFALLGGDVTRLFDLCAVARACTHNDERGGWWADGHRVARQVPRQLDSDIDGLIHPGAGDGQVGIVFDDVGCLTTCLKLIQARRRRWRRWCWGGGGGGKGGEVMDGDRDGQTACLELSVAPATPPCIV